ncbi:MAG: SDR family oxidoreductase [Candidatus Nanopelagicales bacterium]|jgi:3-oxoacyl-[acyl-carrier protein] reductase|nr:SDR family oxidoreductase [Candidatus Nanopelagicales bacterium]
MGALTGRCALVVGGAGGIGGGIAEAFLAEGAKVVIADFNEEVTANRAKEIGSLGVAIDVTNEASVKAGVAKATQLLGQIDILVNSAGIATQAPVVDMTLELWNETIAVDLSGVFLVTHHVLPQMLARSDGRIINVASQLGIKGASSLSHYAAAKAGVIAFTKSLALEVSANGVLVNAIAPGPVYTQMVAGIDEEWKRAKAKELPLGRFGEIAEVAPTAVLLASSPGGNLYVGQTLGPNSGDVMP